MADGLKNSFKSGLNSFRMPRMKPLSDWYNADSLIVSSLSGSDGVASAGKPAARRSSSMSDGLIVRGSRIASSRRAASS